MINIRELYEIYLRYPLVSTDSRDIQNDSIFFALKGENFNGNQFALDAIKNGAAFAVIDEEEFCVDERCLLVENVLVSLQKLATHHISHLNIPVIAIIRNTFFLWLLFRLSLFEISSCFRHWDTQSCFIGYYLLAPAHQSIQMGWFPTDLFPGSLF